MIAAAATPPPVTAYPFTHFLAFPFFSSGLIASAGATAAVVEALAGLPVFPAEEFVVGLPQIPQKAYWLFSMADPQFTQ
jgi:hypothetical protein